MGQGWRTAKLGRLVVCFSFQPTPVVPRFGMFLRPRKSLGIGGHETQAWWHHQAFLGASQTDIDAQRVHVKRRSRQRGHHIHHVQRRMRCCIEGATHRRRRRWLQRLRTAREPAHTAQQVSRGSVGWRRRSCLGGRVVCRGANDQASELDGDPGLKPRANRAKPFQGWSEKRKAPKSPGIRALSPRQWTSPCQPGASAPG